MGIAQPAAGADIHVNTGLAATYNVEYSAGANGSLTGTTSQTVEHGSSSAAVTAVPNAGYHFVQWSDGSTDNPRTDTNVTGDLAVTAEFAINQYTLTYAAGANGSLAGVTAQNVTHGGTGTQVTAVPDAGYAFTRWSDGSTENPRLDTNVTAAINVTAEFVVPEPPAEETDEPLHGTILNSGTLLDPIPGSGAHIIGGKVGGNIVGTGPLPARIDAEILPGSTLCNVNIGADAVLRLPVTLCPSVRFAAGARIPAGMDLSAQFDPLPWAGNTAIVVVNLDVALYEDGTTLRDSLLELPALGGFAITQGAADRTLRAQAEDMLATLLPIAVAQAAPGFVPGLAYDDPGHLVITNASGQRITFLQLPGASTQMETALQSLGLQLVFGADGSLIAVDAEGRPRHVARADVVAIPAQPGSQPGLSQRASHLVANTALMELVFADDEGLLWSQALWAIPLAWEDITMAAQQHSPGSDASLGRDGRMVLGLRTGPLRGYFDYRVEPGTPGANPLQPFAFLGEPADRNGDGTVDWLVIYPDGSKQVLYVLP